MAVKNEMPALIAVGILGQVRQTLDGLPRNGGAIDDDGDAAPTKYAQGTTGVTSCE